MTNFSLREYFKKIESTLKQIKVEFQSIIQCKIRFITNKQYSYFEKVPRKYSPK
jgi:hypothetical protein